MNAVDFNPMLAGSGPREWLIITAVVLFLWACVYSPEILKKFQSDKEGRVVSFLGLTDRPILWLAQGFGVGRIPFAPGTWGSVLGVVWFYALAFTGPTVFAAVTLLSIPLAALVCGEAERILSQNDPPSVVLDEIIAVPISGWLALIWIDRPPAAIAASPWFDQIQQQPWIALVLVFLLFRIFDIWKPWPIRQSQSLPGGWGIVMDDVLAAVYVNLVIVILIAMFALR